MAGEAAAREARRVSWRPGAEGAPVVRALAGVERVRLVVEVGWAEEGAMRRACGGWGVSGVVMGGTVRCTILVAWKMEGEL